VNGTIIFTVGKELPFVASPSSGTTKTNVTLTYISLATSQNASINLLIQHPKEHNIHFIIAPPIIWNIDATIATNRQFLPPQRAWQTMNTTNIGIIIILWAMRR